MVRPKRVLSFMSEWGGTQNRKTASTSTPTPTSASPIPPSPSAKQATALANPASSGSLDNFEYSPGARPGQDSRPSSRPMSMIQTYQPPVMEVSQDTLPELQRIFTFLNSHSNKLYQEGYFLKFHDTDTRGRPAPDRVWQECFAQLVGTILSLWDASELDKVGSEAEVLPTFINLTDAAIHMMPSMVLSDGKKLDNILSVSTAASNKFLFHFNSFNSLTQWTAGIRLAMYEHTTLQEAYTGALIAGKGRQLNNIRVILDRQRAKHEDWARVRFGAGTPWRRCWCVVSPPDDKEYAKLQKSQKKANIYNRSPVVLKGDIKFYDTKKITKKTRPIATVKEAYSCYAIYPQSKPLIDQSTLVKIEGQITIHSNPESVTEGFVFVMPESHPAVSGFEILLRYLFPVFDTFSLYGRPAKLIADVLDSRGLMFAMPPDRRYGYLDLWDVVSLIHNEGSSKWSERQWRKELKNLTSTRMNTAPSRNNSRAGSRRNTISRASLPPSHSGNLRFEERGIVRSHPSTRQASPNRSTEFEIAGPRRVDSAPPAGGFVTPRHQRSVSETNGYKQYQSETPSRLAHGISADSGFDSPPPPPPHQTLGGVAVYDSPVDGQTPSPDGRDLPEPRLAASLPPQGHVATPPLFAHAPSQKPPVQPYLPSAKPNPQMDTATLHQMADATNAPLPADFAVAGAAAALRGQENQAGRRSGDYDQWVENRHHAQTNANGGGYQPDQYSQNTTGSRSGQSGNRLPTIPASPYVEHSEFIESPVVYQPTAPPVPEHSVLPASQPNVDVAFRQRPGSSSSSQIHRKPVPGRSPPPSREAYDNRSIASSSLGSLRNNIIDPEALDSLNNADSPPLPRHPSQSSSRYSDDAISTSTPDYASTISEEVKPRKLPGRREDRPRSGVLKFVGTDSSSKPDVVVGDTHYKSDTTQPTTSTDIPTIDFGPTYNLNPAGKRPGTSGTMTQAAQDNSFSRSKENFAISQESKQSYSGRTTPIAATHMRSSSSSPQASDARSIMWQPGMASQNQSSDRQKLDPEEWVQQRASMAGPYQSPPPVYPQGRSTSRTPPPMARAQSGDWAHLQRTPEAMPGRPPSRPLSRPVSRGAGTLLDQRPTSLSAREIEQVARVTGTPLLDLKQNPKHKQKPSAEGLTAYIDHREKEKAAAKANRHTPAMQAEIDRRLMATQQRQMLEMQQQQMLEMQQQQMAMAQAQSNYTPSMMGTPQGLAPGFAYSSPAQMQQMYGQPGYFPQPSPVMSQGLQQPWGTPSPSQMQGPYFAAQQQQQQPPMQMQQPQQQPAVQPYGASFDQAQAAARYSHQQAQQPHRRG
ncbi:hypothetical protein P154DRAFT_174608 [Amniculicola lignicola CBS 123094]|uniref:PH domain-containing protein n=1 Tax=Amniculicola lignicola CBS 123094 TaxID=1392246 RepID=A0A6A5WQ56_9PLEO|nr:hypothetical protein P154DRAFT_174608 [Amniculicola lignicola CBS 123094]